MKTLKTFMYGVGFFLFLYLVCALIGLTEQSFSKPWAPFAVQGLITIGGLGIPAVLVYVAGGFIYDYFNPSDW